MVECAHCRELAKRVFRGTGDPIRLTGLARLQLQSKFFLFCFDNSENPVIFKNDLKNDLESQKAMPNKAHAAPKVHYHAVERVLGDAVGQCDP